MTKPRPKSLREYLKGPPRVSQRALARQVGCNQAMVSMLAAGTRRPRAALALRLHKMTGVPLEALLAPPRRVKKSTTTQMTQMTTEIDDAYHDDADDDPRPVVFVAD